MALSNLEKMQTITQELFDNIISLTPADMRQEMATVIEKELNEFQEESKSQYNSIANYSETGPSFKRAYEFVEANKLQKKRNDNEMDQ